MTVALTMIFPAEAGTGVFIVGAHFIRVCRFPDYDVFCTNDFRKGGNVVSAGGLRRYGGIYLFCDTDFIVTFADDAGYRQSAQLVDGKLFRDQLGECGSDDGICDFNFAGRVFLFEAAFRLSAGRGLC